MAPFDKPYVTFYWSTIVNIALSRIILVTMVVSVAVCGIFSVKEWCDLENGVRVCSRSLETASFDRSHTSSYSPSIVTMAICCIVARYSDLLLENGEIFIPHLYLAPPQGVTPSKFCENI